MRPEVDQGLELLKMVEGKHTPVCACDECLRYKSKLSPIPDGRTDRPRRTERVRKLYLDPSGKLCTLSIYHNFQYYVLGVTDEGYTVVGGMTFSDQVLFVIGRMFDSLGEAPFAGQVDLAGESNSKLQFEDSSLPKATSRTERRESIRRKQVSIGARDEW
jgi:hypothetical protein